MEAHGFFRGPMVSADGLLLEAPESGLPLSGVVP